jgi:uncharacterized membrane protein
MLVPESIVTLLKPWADFYSHSKTTETIVTYMHIGGLLLAGGLAIGSDRASVRVMRQPAGQRPAVLQELAAVHRWVIGGLGVVVVSGLMLLLSDIETFLGSWIFWVKMLMVAVLLLNGLMMTRIEKGLATDASESSRHWISLRRASQWSLALWFAITLAGVALLNFA